MLFIRQGKRLAEYKHHLTDVHEFGNVWHGITGTFDSERISIIVAGIGPSLVGDAVYALNRPNSICLYSGTCGGLAEGLEIGDYFVADQAVCGDGYSSHIGYVPLSAVSGHPNMLSLLRALLVERVKRVEFGTVFTTSSVVLETVPHFWDAVDKQCGAIEMEAAAFYAAARATGKRAAAYFWVTDLPRQGKSFFDTLDARERETKQARYNQTISLNLKLLAHLQ